MANTAEAAVLGGAGSDKLRVSPVGVRKSFRRFGERGLAAHPGSSFVIQDHGRMILGRGCFSGTPIYYFTDPSWGTTCSASLRELARSFEARPDAAGVRDYLCYGFVPAPRTILQGVSAVAPGTALICDLRTGERRRISLAPRGYAGGDPVAALWSEVERAATARRPTGVLLSGGLDSAAVAVTAHARGCSLTAFHARFPGLDRRVDEDTACARAVARHLGLNYREVRIGSLDALKWFQRVVASLDQPLGDPVLLPFYLLLRQARERHRMVLTGEGGDQLFGSWPTRPMLVGEAYGAGGGHRHRAYVKSFHKFPEDWPELLSANLRAGLAGAPEPWQPVAEAWCSSPAADLYDTLRWVDIRLKGMQHIVPRIEAMAAAHSIDLAHPLFQPRVVEMSFLLDPKWKVDPARDKPLLKDLVGPHLPQQVIERPKAGMGVPTSAWFARGLRPLAWRWLRRSRLRCHGILDPEGVRAVVRRQLQPRDARHRRWGDHLWMLCVLEAWFESLEIGAGSLGSGR